MLVEVQDYQDEREVTLRTGDVAYLMSDTGNTLASYYPAPKRGGLLDTSTELSYFRRCAALHVE